MPPPRSAVGDLGIPLSFGFCFAQFSSVVLELCRNTKLRAFLGEEEEEEEEACSTGFVLVLLLIKL
jgi:hypothetical protein